MDLSDGLQMDAPRLARASGLTLELDLSLLPEDPLLLHLSPQQRAAGGEDLGLLVSVPPARVEVFQRRGFTSLGRALTKQDQGYVRWLEDGREVHLTSEPFRHFSQERGPDS